MEQTEPLQAYPVDREVWEKSLNCIVDFLRHIGLTVNFSALDGAGFVPGIQIQHGEICIDQSQLLFPGDLLHEAGHLATVTSHDRRLIHLDSGPDMGNEIGAICWSYAATQALELPLDIVFHPHGYKGASAMFIEHFNEGTYIGLPLLEWMGLTYSKKTAEEKNVPPFPVMQRWLRA